MSEEIMTSAADLNTMIGLRAENDGLRQRMNQAERENAQLHQQLDYVVHDRELEYARMAALVEACEALAEFVDSYASNSRLALNQPTFYANFRVYGKNARAAVTAVRPQADALLARLADLSRMVGEQNTTIGYQDAMLARLRSALSGLIGAESADELRAMETALRMMAAPAADKAAMIDAIHALLNTKGDV